MTYRKPKTSRRHPGWQQRQDTTDGYIREFAGHDLRSNSHFGHSERLFICTLGSGLVPDRFVAEL